MAIQFNGLTNISGIDVNNVPSTTQLIIHFWFKITQDPVDLFGYFFDSTNNNGTYIRFDKSIRRIKFDVYGDNGLSILSIIGFKVFDYTEQEVSVDLVVDQVTGLGKVYFDGVEDRSVVPDITPLISHNNTGVSIGSRFDKSNYLPAGTMIDDFYYSNFIPDGFVSNNGLTAEYMKSFYDIDRFGTRLYKKKNAPTTAGIPQLVFANDYDDFGKNNGTEKDATVFGTPEEYTGKGYIK